VDVTVENRGQQRAEHTLKRPRNAEIGCKTASASLAVDFPSIQDSFKSLLLNIEDVFSTR